MPATERLLDEFRAAGTQVLGVSIDSLHSHNAWGKALGGISFPLLQDFHPKGAMAKSYGLYLEDAGITDRATVLIDKEGVIRFSESVSPGGKRDISTLVAEAKKLGGSEADMPAKGELPDGYELYVKSPCGHSDRALAAIANLHLQDKVKVFNITEDASARDSLVERAGKDQAPCMCTATSSMYEAAEICLDLANRVSPLHKA